MKSKKQIEHEAAVSSSDEGYMKAMEKVREAHLAREAAYMAFVAKFGQQYPELSLLLADFLDSLDDEHRWEDYDTTRGFADQTICSFFCFLMDKENHHGKT
jgi:hypothetical protein